MTTSAIFIFLSFERVADCALVCGTAVASLLLSVVCDDDKLDKNSELSERSGRERLESSRKSEALEQGRDLRIDVHNRSLFFLVCNENVQRTLEDPQICVA